MRLRVAASGAHYDEILKARFWGGFDELSERHRSVGLSGVAEMVGVLGPRGSQRFLDHYGIYYWLNILRIQPH